MQQTKQNPLTIWVMVGDSTIRRFKGGSNPSPNGGNYLNWKREARGYVLEYQKLLTKLLQLSSGENRLPLLFINHVTRFFIHTVTDPETKPDRRRWSLSLSTLVFFSFYPQWIIQISFTKSKLKLINNLCNSILFEIYNLLYSICVYR